MKGHLTAAAVLSVAFAGTLASASFAEAETRTLRQVVYDYAVTSYCGLLTPEVEFGFQHELDVLTEQSGLNPADARALRIAGWVDADREWSNRGLGGFRAWCRDDGLAAARRFLDVTRTRASP
jgi:hypothetical protein